LYVFVYQKYIYLQMRKKTRADKKLCRMFSCLLNIG